MDDPHIFVERLQFSDGSHIDFRATDIVILTGPNNSGKSRALQDIQLNVRQKPGRVVVPSANVGFNGNEDQFRQYFYAHTQFIPDRKVYVGHRTLVHDTYAHQPWPQSIPHFADFFTSHLTTDSRLEGSQPFNRSGHHQDPTQHPIELLFADNEMEELVSNYFCRAFGQDLIVDRLDSRAIPLRVGAKFAQSTDKRESTKELRNHLDTESTPLSDQGDGMRAFATVASTILSEPTASIFLVDEPEAFLHPPQARLMGEFIVRECRGRGQFFVATHSPDFIHGALSTNPDRVRVIRFQRFDNVNNVTELQSGDVLEIAHSPLLRYSGVVGGVFSERTIVCESYADCTFYNAILDLDSVHGLQHPNVSFVHAGGISGAHVLASKLITLGVRVDVIVDIDVVCNLDEMRRIVDALSDKWGEVADDARIVERSVREAHRAPASNQVVDEIQQLLMSAPRKEPFPKNTQRQIERIFSRLSPRHLFKQAGKSSLKGASFEAFGRLSDTCNSFGLWIVPVGELEGFCRRFDSKGSKWVRQILSSINLAEDAELETARDFIRRVWESSIPVDRA